MLDFCTVTAGAGRGTGSIGETAVPGGMALGKRSWGSTEAAHPSTDPDSLEKQQPIFHFCFFSDRPSGAILG